MEALNENLLNALISKGICDVYLFTDMTFSQSTLVDRQNLIEQLKKKGFRVHGVITPSDLTWDIPDDEALKLHKWCLEDGTYQGQLSGAPFETFIQSKKEELPELCKAASDYRPNNNGLGKSFESAISSNNVSYNNIKKKGVITKNISDLLAEKKGFKHTKGLLLDSFLRHMPSWVESIVIADDNLDVIDSVSSVKSKDVINANIPITVIPVTDIKNHTQEDYRLILKDYADIKQTEKNEHDLNGNLLEIPDDDSNEEQIESAPDYQINNKSKLVGLLDVDDTLIISYRDNDGNRRYKLNHDLIQALKEENLPCYLFTNTGISDINRIGEVSGDKSHGEVCLDYNPEHEGYGCIPRPVIVNYLLGQGIKIAGVITPADPGYNQGLGKAYDDLLADDYKAAIEYAENMKEGNDQPGERIILDRKHPFETNKSNLPETLSDDDKKALTKQRMYQYVLEQQPNSHFIYFDDDRNCLDKVNDINNQHNAQHKNQKVVLKTYQVRLNTSTADVNQDDSKDNYVYHIKKSKLANAVSDLILSSNNILKRFNKSSPKITNEKKTVFDDFIKFYEKNSENKEFVTQTSLLLAWTKSFQKTYNVNPFEILGKQRRTGFLSIFNPSITDSMDLMYQFLGEVKIPRELIQLMNPNGQKQSEMYKYPGWVR